MGLDKSTVQTLFNEVQAGRVVLPDFQRSFVWKADQIRELLVSLVGKYYVGTFLYMDMVTSSSIFALRLVEGVEKVNPGVKMHDLVTAILDGQQRTTSLFYALAGPDLPLKGKKGGARFFLHLPSLLDNRWDDSVVFVAANNKKELAAHRESPDYVETTRILVPTDVAKSLQGTEYEDQSWDIAQILNDLLQYQFHHVELPKSTPLDRVVETFQRINEHVGEPLSIKDLLVARLYKDDIKFRELLADYRDSDLAEIDADFVLKVMALVRDGEIRRRNLLGLESEAFEADWADAVKAVNRGRGRILSALGYGTLAWKKVPSKHLIIILGALLMVGRRLGMLDAKAYKKIDRWYWTSVFTDRYDSAVNTSVAADWKTVRAWVFDGGPVPDFITEFSPADVDLDVSSRSSATYKGVLGLVVLAGARDYKTNQVPKFDPNRAQDDHIFPKSQYHYNGICNRTIVTSSNQNKGNLIPSVFFKSLVTINGRQALVETLRSHLIPEEGLDYLLNNDLEGFVETRKKAVRAEIAVRTQ